MEIHEMLVPFLAFVGVVSVGGAMLSARAARKAPVRARLVDTAAAMPPAPTKRGVVSGLGQLAALGPASTKLKQSLAMAGFHNASAATTYLGAKVLMMLMTAAAAGLAVAPLDLKAETKVGIIFGAGAMMFFVPNLYVEGRKKRRRAQVRAHLPDAVDLLEVCVSAGMGLDMAWNMVGDEVRSVCLSLADEMALANLEIHLGATREAALRHLADRTGVEEIRSLVAVLVQSERFGTSISDALRAFTSSMREGRSARAEEDAERMSVRLLFPMIFFIFPAVFIVIAGPTAMTLIRVMSG